VLGDPGDVGDSGGIRQRSYSYNKTRRPRRRRRLRRHPSKKSTRFLPASMIDVCIYNDNDMFNKIEQRVALCRRCQSTDRVSPTMLLSSRADPWFSVGDKRRPPDADPQPEPTWTLAFYFARCDGGGLHTSGKGRGPPQCRLEDRFLKL
jgi:hypothetical protein